MKMFPGFPEGPVRMTPVPAAFFIDLLPAIDHLGELKITLYALWALAQQEGKFRYLSLGKMSQEDELLKALSETGGEGKSALKDALERAVVRGTLLRVRPGKTEEAYFFLNSARGRAAASAMEHGEWNPEEHPAAEALWVDRPNVFTLYEQNIGALTPLAADMIRDAEKNYPAGWIEEAIRIAVEHNARSWKYVSAILERWQQEGRRDRKESGGADRRKYIEGEYADFIKH